MPLTRLVVSGYVNISILKSKDLIFVSEKAFFSVLRQILTVKFLPACVHEVCVAYA